MLSRYNREIDIDTVERVFRRIRKITLKRTGSKGPGFIWRRKYTTFYNQISLTYQDEYSNKSVKVFPNGSIHVTGASSLLDCNRIMNQLTLIFQMLLKWPKDTVYGNPRIVMINTNYSLNWSIDQYAMIEKLENDGRFEVDYDPAYYSAIKVKFKPGPGMKKIAANIFGSGNIIITGAQTLKEIAYAYRILNEQITSDERVAKNAVVKMHDVFLGGRFQDWVPILKKKGFGAYVDL